MITSYNQLSVGKYNELEAIAHDRSLDDIGRNTAILAVLTDKSERELMDMPIGEYAALGERASFLLHPAPAAQKTPRSYKLGEMELIPSADFTRMTAAQYIDYQTYANQQSADQLVQMLSCMLIPKGHKYNDGYDMGAVQSAIRDNMPITDAAAYANFLLAKWRKSMRISLSYLALKSKRRERMRLWELVEMLSIRNGGGLTLWIW